MMFFALFACVALQTPLVAETNVPPPVVEVVARKTAPAVTTNIVKTVSTNLIPVKVVYPDVAAEDFCLEAWAETLAKKTAQGVYIRNGQVLVVVHLEAVEGEYQALTKLRAKFRAIEFLRHHFIDLPNDFSTLGRVLVCKQSDSDERCTIVMAFKLEGLNVIKIQKD